MARLISGTVRFLYRLVLFPWMTTMQLALTMASQFNWLMTGHTFQDVERLQKRERREVLDRLMRN